MEELKLILDFIFVLPFAIFPLAWGFDDGYMKKHGTEHHKIKYVIFLCVGYFLYFEIGYEAILGFLLLYKPAFDTGWSYGNSKKDIFIGTTEWTDRLIRRLGLYRDGKFSIIHIIYFFAFFVGLFIIHLFTRGVLPSF